MLYLKQTQMERLAADKAATHLRLEREVEAARDEVNRLRAQVGEERGAMAGEGVGER